MTDERSPRLGSTIWGGLLSGSSLKRRLLSGGAWAVGGKVGASMIGLATSALLTRLLSRSEVGVYFLAISVVTIGAVIGALGLPKTVVRFVAQSMALDQVGRARGVIYLVLGLGVVGALGVGLAYGLFVGKLLGNLFDSRALAALTGLMAGWIALSVVLEITAETFRGFHDIRMATLLGGSATGGKSGGLVMRVLLLGGLAWVWLTTGETDVRTVVLISIGAGVASGLLSVWLLRSKVSSLGTSEAGQAGAGGRIGAGEALRDALPVLLISLTSFVLLSASDLWILGAFRPKEEVAIYAVSAQLVALIAMPLLMTNLVLPPIIAEMYAQGQMGRLERTVRTFSTLAGAPSLLFLAAFMLLGGPILGLVYGERLFPPGSPALHQGAIVLVLLSLGRLAAVWSGSCGAVLQFTGHQMSMLWVSLLTSPLFIIGALLVVRDYGPVGVAGMTALTAVVQNVIMVLVAKKKTGIWTHASLSLSPFRKAFRPKDDSEPK
jgi:O-antigen/teichoic acid export membrane protein